MPAYDLIYFMTYLVFLLGAFWELRARQKRAALWIMASGVVVDFFAAILPNAGFRSQAINIGVSAVIVSAITLEILVWTAFLAAVFVRLTGLMGLYLNIITAIKVIWFVDIILFVYGVYGIYA